MKKQLLALAMALLVLLSVTAMASTGRYDQQIQQAVSHKIRDAKHLENVNSSVEDGIVTLTGTVDLYQNKLDAAKTTFRKSMLNACPTPFFSAMIQILKKISGIPTMYFKAKIHRASILSGSDIIIRKRNTPT